MMTPAVFLLSFGALGMLAGPALASSVPKVNGHSVTEDKYVKEFRETMSSVESEINAIKAAIEAMPPTVGQAAGFADEAKVLSLYAPMADLMRKAEGAHMKMLKHIMGGEAFKDRDFDVALGLPPFEQKQDDPRLKPHDDGMLQDSPEPGQGGAGAGISEGRPDIPPGPGEILAGALKGGADGKPPDPAQLGSAVDEAVSSLKDRMLMRQVAAERLLEEAKNTAH